DVAGEGDEFAAALSSYSFLTVAGSLESAKGGGRRSDRVWVDAARQYAVTVIPTTITHGTDFLITFRSKYPLI
ncbi:hypothetical protein Trydic_g10535, partial [Trypoxylus dichotomus]